MIKLIEDYKNALQAIYDHVGLVEDWVVCPIDDATRFYWSLAKGRVGFSESLEDLETQEGEYYEDEIYTQRFYKKHVYKGKDFTLVFCDTKTDGMKYWRLFDNKLRQDINIEDCDE